MYENGDGLDQDLSQAAKWYKEAADQGHRDAQYNLGLAYYKGAGVHKNFDNAIYYFSQASNQNHMRASFNLGVMYYRGDGLGNVVPDSFAMAGNGEWLSDLE